MQTIPRRSSRCILGNELFEQGSDYISSLDPEGIRKDYCMTCWEKLGKPQQTPFWRGVIPSKEEKTCELDLKIVRYFKEAEDPKVQYILAMHLQKKNKLIRRTGSLYEIPETGELFHIEKQMISSEESDRLAELMTDLLNLSQ